MSKILILLKKIFNQFYELCKIIVFNKYFNTFIFFCVIISIFNLLISKIIDFSNSTNYFIDQIDYIIVIFFSFEFIIKFIDKKWKYLFNDYGWIDFLASLPILTPALKGLRSVRLLRISRILRLLRFLKISQETPSPLKQKFFAGISSLTLIVILLLGYGLYNYQFKRLLENEIRYIDFIKTSLENGIDINAIFNKEPSILRIQKYDNEYKTKKISNKINIENLLKIRSNNPQIIKKIIVNKYMNDKENVIQHLDNIFQNNTLNYKDDINDLDENELNKIISVIDWEKIDINTYNFFMNLLRTEIKNYFLIENDLLIFENNINNLKNTDILLNKLIGFKTENNYIVLYSMKNFLKTVNTFEAFIISISFFTVVIIILGLNFFLQNILLDRLLILSSQMKTTIEDYKTKRNIKNDIANPFEQKKDNDDEVTILINAYNYLKNKLDESFSNLNIYINRIKTLNTIYNYFQNTYDLEKHFNYILLALTNKNYYKFDRAAIFLKNYNDNNYSCEYSIGANNRSELISKFKDKNKFYNFNPSLNEAFDMYKSHPYYNNEFTKLFTDISFENILVEKDLNEYFKKYGNVIKYPTDYIVDNNIFKTLSNKLNTNEFIISKLEISDNIFGFIFLDNSISNEQITNFRIQNVALFINEIQIILFNLLFSPYMSDKNKLEINNDNFVLEKDKTAKIIKKIFGL